MENYILIPFAGEIVVNIRNDDTNNNTDTTGDDVPDLIDITADGDDQDVVTISNNDDID